MARKITANRPPSAVLRNWLLFLHFPARLICCDGRHKSNLALNFFSNARRFLGVDTVGDFVTLVWREIQCQSECRHVGFYDG
jgi:hypothetical protein